jgi:flavin reductase (DIM6/NTAB) family NADH-FMN oxidoreductase RutF
MAQRPWNRVNLPVYSISSQDGKGNHNMHIITYATQISMKPKRFVCGIYQGTRTLENIQQHPRFVLQLLAADQYRLTDLLGKKSGHSVNKIERLEKRKLLINWKDYRVLAGSLALMELSVLQSFDGGDHTGFLCEVLDFKNLQEGEPLTLDILRAHKLIRI